MAPKVPFAFLSLFFTAGGLLLMFLVLLAGTSDHNPLNQIYFLEADTSGIPNAPNTSRWTFWNLCSVTASHRNKCGSVHPAFPLDPPSHRNFGTRVDIPHQFFGTKKYFYLTRFMFAFNLIALFFHVMAFFTGLLALCSRVGAYLSGFLNGVGLFFLTITNSLMTAAYVIGRDNFRSNSQSAHVGNFAFAFLWSAWASFFISIVMGCLAGKGRKETTTYKSSGTKRRFPRFGGKRNKSTRSRSSFAEGRIGGIKDDYA